MYQTPNVPRSGLPLVYDEREAARDRRLEHLEREREKLLRAKRDAAPAPAASGGGELAKSLSTIIVGLLCTLIGTGIVSSISLYARVSTLTEAQARTDQQLQRHLDNAVDKDSYQRRDQALQKMIDSKASEGEVTELRLALDKALDRMASKDDVQMQMRTLQTIQDTILTRSGRPNR